MKNLMTIFVGVFTAVYLTGCVPTSLIPPTSVTYSPQNFTRYNGACDIGKFEYRPASIGKVALNEIPNPAGNITLTVNIDDLVQRGTVLELERTGFIIGDKYPLQISGEVLEFSADDLGSKDWTYSIRYKIVRKADSVVLFDKVYKADPKNTGMIVWASDYTPPINAMILSAYNKFIRDDQVRKLFAP